jgi:hypothetical protein
MVAPHDIQTAGVSTAPRADAVVRDARPERRLVFIDGNRATQPTLRAVWEGTRRCGISGALVSPQSAAWEAAQGTA